MGLEADEDIPGLPEVEAVEAELLAGGHGLELDVEGQAGAVEVAVQGALIVSLKNFHFARWNSTCRLFNQRRIYTRMVAQCWNHVRRCFTHSRTYLIVRKGTIVPI